EVDGECAGEGIEIGGVGQDGGARAVGLLVHIECEVSGAKSRGAEAAVASEGPSGGVEGRAVKRVAEERGGVGRGEGERQKGGKDNRGGFHDADAGLAGTGEGNGPDGIGAPEGALLVNRNLC